MSPIRRVMLCGAILTSGFAAQAGLEEMNKIERPPLRASLRTIPLEMGDWIGRDESVPAQIIEKAQTTEYLNRVYESKTHPGRQFKLWINYSLYGNNLRHSPTICLPSAGWEIVESECRVLSVPDGAGKTLRLSRLAYSQGSLVQGIGFWYYIFGEGALERYVRRLPITSRSSHGRTTRGSSMTVEVFSLGENDRDDALLQDFAQTLLGTLEDIVPEDRAEYYVP